MCLLFHSSFCAAQSLKGKIKLNERWKQVVYLIEVSDYQMLFSGSSNNVVDSFYISSEGYFYFDKLKRNTLYRLNVVPESLNVSGMFIQDGKEDNYAFFASGSERNDIYFTADIARLYRSYRLVCVDHDMNELQKEILAVREMKLPNYDSMVALGNQMKDMSPSDTGRLIAFQHSVILKLQEVNNITNATLLKQLRTFKNPQSVSLGLIYCDFGQILSDSSMPALLEKLRPYTKDPLAQSILKAGKKSLNEIDKSFLSREHTWIDGRKIRLDSISSKFILLDFWASWCMPCRKAIRTDLKNLLQEFGRSDLLIIGVNGEQDKKMAIQAVKKDNNTAPQIWEGDSRYLNDLFEIRELPYYLLINTQTKEVTVVKSAELISGALKKSLRE